MGRTNPTFRRVLDSLADRWAPYRRGLRRAAQARFDRLLEYARDHADASTYLNHSDPTVPVLLSIDLEQEARLDDLESRLEELEEE